MRSGKGKELMPQEMVARSCLALKESIFQDVHLFKWLKK
jgi:hypothetical protein